VWPFSRKEKPLDLEGFAVLFTKRLQQAGESRPIRYDRDAQTLVLGGGESRVNIENFFADWQAAPPELREAGLARALKAVRDAGDIPADFALAAPGLVPRIRERVFHELVRLQLQVDPRGVAEIPHRPLGRDFTVGLGFDREHSVAVVMNDQLKAWGKTLEEALVPALENLRKRSEGDWVSIAQGAWASPWKDDHDPARVLLPEVIAVQEVRGLPVVMITGQNSVLLSGSEDALGLQAMAERAVADLSKPRAMGGAAMVLEGGAWKPFEPPPGRPGAEAMRAARLHFLHRDYAEQGQILKAGLAKRNEDVFVAAFMLLEDKRTGSKSSLTTWAEGVEAMLPETETIAFGRIVGGKPGPLRGRVAWAEVRRVMGERMKPMGMFPERYRVGGFPTESEFKAMGV
jgi:hypothetical protein